jgi:hypothetical protein
LHDQQSRNAHVLGCLRLDREGRPVAGQRLAFGATTGRDAITRALAADPRIAPFLAIPIKEPLLTPIDQHFPRAAWGNPPAPSGTPVPGDGRVLPPAAGGEGAVMPPIQRAGSEPGGTPQVSVEAPI